MKAVEIKNVSFAYDGYNNKILDEINFYLNYGEIAFLSGFSGQGKSTLVSLISGIIPNIINGVLSGNIFINDKSIIGKKVSDICRDVGIVLQNADSQIIQSIVEDEISFGCENFAFSIEEISKKIDSSCKLMKLNKFWETRTLSGGQKQRLITASTLATEQKIIILDEPLANLDKSGANDLMLILKELAKNGYAILVVEHRLDMVLPYVDIVWHIDNGKVFFVEDIKSYQKNESKTIKDICNKDESKKYESLIVLNNVSLTLGERQIINNLSLNIEKGNRYVFLGENGSGKTTLLRLIAKLYKPTSGTIIQNIINLNHANKPNKKWFKKVGIVYQNPNYQLFMATVRDEISFSAVSEEYCLEIIKKFQLTEILNRHPHSLSEGQKRKVSIAAILAAKPDLLLLDEPTVGQDFEGLKDIVNILNEIHIKTNNTIITITHDIRCAEALCDKAVIIENGAIIKLGNKETVSEYFDNI